MALSMQAWKTCIKKNDDDDDDDDRRSSCYTLSKVLDISKIIPLRSCM